MPPKRNQQQQQQQKSSPPQLVTADSATASKFDTTDFNYDDDTNRTHTVLNDKTMPAPQDTAVSAYCPSLTAAESLAARHYYVHDDFVAPGEVQQLRDEVRRYHRDGHMAIGEIGSLGVRRDMRDDVVCNFESNDAFVGPVMKRHVLRADVFAQKVSILLRAGLERPDLAWDGCGRTKLMASLYEPDVAELEEKETTSISSSSSSSSSAGGGAGGNSQGNKKRRGARYVAHYDNPNGNGRKLTTILYLNAEWKPADGGHVRLKTQTEVVDVAPLGGRLVCFWSDKRVPHEVLPSNAMRFAITVWFFDEAERREYAARMIREQQQQQQQQRRTEAGGGAAAA